MSALLFETIRVGPLACNCSIVVDTNTGAAAVIDAGDECERILPALQRAGARAVFLLHTHAHFDHIAAAGAVRAATGAAICLHPDDKFLYDQLVEQGRMFGLTLEPPAPVDRFLSDGEVFQIGNSSIRVIHTPGHSPGSTCFLLQGDTPILFSGDTLFRDSIGRTDLWGGSFETIAESIQMKLYCLPESLRVVPGHGEDTTVGRERRSNPFVRPLS